jgi:hypothetical protein
MLASASGLPAARRLLELLAGVPAWRAADVVAAALARSSQVCVCVGGGGRGIVVADMMCMMCTVWRVWWQLHWRVCGGILLCVCTA